MSITNCNELSGLKIPACICNFTNKISWASQIVFQPDMHMFLANHTIVSAIAALINDLKEILRTLLDENRFLGIYLNS